MTGPQPRVRVAEHNGDATIDVTGADEAACLRGAVQGLAALAGAAAASPSNGRDQRTVAVDAGEPVERLVALLNELIVIVDVEGLVAVDADNVAVGDSRVAVVVRLAPLDPAAVAAPPKAATWHGARSQPGGGRWHARVVVDR